MLRSVSYLQKVVARAATTGIVQVQPCRGYNRQGVSTPTLAQLEKLNKATGLEVTSADLAQYQELIRGFVSAYDYLDKVPDDVPPVKYPRTPGYRPSPEDNPGNAWYWRCDVRADPASIPKNGLLAGKTVALKDNIALAGVPMMNGSKVLEGYIPEYDATVVTRILEAGGRIVGKAACEDNCLSGSSHTTIKGRVENPNRDGYSSGGSSSGCAYVLATGQVDVAVGGDQGGSIRIPSGWSGLVGLKPTHGLVPYTGIVAIEPSVDHVGPMARTVEDAACLLEAIAGEDGLDPRQPRGIKGDAYTSKLRGDPSKLRLAVVDEGFLGDDQATDDAVRRAIGEMREAGAHVDRVSIPLHEFGAHIWTPVCLDGFYQSNLLDGGSMTGSHGFHPTSLIQAYHRGLTTHKQDLQHIVKATILFCRFINESYGKAYYAKGLNVSRRLTAAYDQVLEKYDALVMPTLPYRATQFPPQDCSTIEFLNHGLHMLHNTAPFDITGHPAITIKCGQHQDLPIGMMFVGKHFNDAKVLDAAFGYEKLPDKY